MARLAGGSKMLHLHAWCLCEWLEVCGQLDTPLSPGSQGVFLCGVLKRDDEFLTQWFRDPVKTVPEDTGRSFKVFLVTQTWWFKKVTFTFIWCELLRPSWLQGREIILAVVFQLLSHIQLCVSNLFVTSWTAARVLSYLFLMTEMSNILQPSFIHTVNFKWMWTTLFHCFCFWNKVPEVCLTLGTTSAPCIILRKDLSRR